MTGKWTVSPGQFPLRHFLLTCSVKVRVRNGVSKVRAKVASVGLGLVGLLLGLGL